MGKTYEDVYAAAEALAGELIDEATLVSAETFGLDRRAAYRLWLGGEQDCIIVQSTDDGALQYYGGFEYVDKQYRTELGGYVVYSGEDSRVRRHLDIALDVEQEEIDPTPEDITASKADLYNDMKKCEED